MGLYSTAVDARSVNSKEHTHHPVNIGLFTSELTTARDLLHVSLLTTLL